MDGAPASEVEVAMSNVREQLTALSTECESLCTQARWLGKGKRPNFRLIYSSVESYEHGNGFAILGLNPAGDGRDAIAADIERPFQEPGYSAYLDDQWRGFKAGAAPLQLVVQALAMVMAGAPPSEAIAAMDNTRLTPEERIGAQAAYFLRSTPSLNIIPFRDSNLGEIPAELREKGESIGWQLLCLIHHKLRYVVTLANQIGQPPWRTILKNSAQVGRADYEEPVHTGMRRTYREVRLMHGPLMGATLIGLPAVVRDQGKKHVTRPLLEIVARRLREHTVL